MINWQDKVVERITTLDREKKIVKQISRERIVYNESNLGLGRKISTTNDEELVRALLLCKLHYELDYPLNGAIEVEKEYEAGRPKKIKPRIDVIVRDKGKTGDNSAFLFMEVKAPDKFDLDQNLIEGQLFNLALLETRNGPVKYLVYYSIDIRDDELKDRAIIIDCNNFHTYEDWDNNGRVSLDTLPKAYGIARKRRYANIGQDITSEDIMPLDSSVTSEKFFVLRRDLHSKLWGGGSMSYNDIFSNLVKLFLAKIFDEETTHIGDEYGFQIEFNGDEPEAPEETYARINALFKQSQIAYLGYSEQDVQESVGIDREKMTPNKVAYVVEKLQGISLRENRNKEVDLLGEFFEGIVSDGFKQDKGQFFTHANIVNFILTVMEVEELAEYMATGKEDSVKIRLPYICDPSCGSGNFLIIAMKRISKVLQNLKKTKLSYKSREFLASGAPDFTPNVWAKEYLYGVEIHSDLATSTKVNMVLHGDGNINIFSKSGLLDFSEYQVPSKVSVLAQKQTIDLAPLKGVFPEFRGYPINGQFDMIVSNPPFSIDLDTDSLRALVGNFIFAHRTNSETVFIERWLQLLRDNGRLGVVLPDSVFDNKDDVDIRIFIYRFFEIKAIVSLPMLAFKPYTPTKTSILFARKKTRSEVREFDELWDNTYDNVLEHIAILDKGLNKITLKEDKTQTAIKYLLDGKIPDEELETDIMILAKTYVSLIKECINNPVWVAFGKVSDQLGYDFAIAHAEEVGYKRSKKLGEQKRPNQLFDDPFALTTEDITEEYPRILDFMKGMVRW